MMFVVAGAEPQVEQTKKTNQLDLLYSSEACNTSMTYYYKLDFGRASNLVKIASYNTTMQTQ